MLFEILTQDSINEIYIRAVKNIYKRTTSVIKMERSDFQSISDHKRFQSCCRLNTLFKIYIQEALTSWRKKWTEIRVEIDQGCLKMFFFSGYLILITNDEGIE